MVVQYLLLQKLGKDSTQEVHSKYCSIAQQMEIQNKVNALLTCISRIKYKLPTNRNIKLLIILHHFTSRLQLLHYVKLKYIKQASRKCDCLPAVRYAHIYYFFNNINYPTNSGDLLQFPFILLVPTIISFPFRKYERLSYYMARLLSRRHDYIDFTLN